MKEFKMLKIFIFMLLSNYMYALELVIGEEKIDPGIVFIFEGAIKDHIMPMSMHMSENQTNVHIEARVNWDSINIPDGTPVNGFIPYLYINSMITNQKTGIKTFIDLLPHINLVDNFHYARNISLPGSVDDLYTVEFNVIPPTHMDLALHKDWLDAYGDSLMKSAYFKYRNVDFSEIARAKRH